MLPFLCSNLARSILFIHADLLAFLPDFICSETELSWEWKRWYLNVKHLSWAQLSSEALSHRTPLCTLRRRKFSLLMLRVMSPPHCPRILNSTISCSWNPAATDRPLTHHVYSSSWMHGVRHFRGTPAHCVPGENLGNLFVIVPCRPFLACIQVLQVTQSKVSFEDFVIPFCHTDEGRSANRQKAKILHFSIWTVGY